MAFLNILCKDCSTPLNLQVIYSRINTRMLKSTELYCNKCQDEYKRITPVSEEHLEAQSWWSKRCEEAQFEQNLHRIRFIQDKHQYGEIKTIVEVCMRNIFPQCIFIYNTEHHQRLKSLVSFINHFTPYSD